MNEPVAGGVGGNYPEPPSPDESGRDRMTRNVLFSWAGQIVFLIAGFLMPRFIDRHIGQAGLGVWDFGWSVVNYFGLASIGIGSSVNRYVAKYRAEKDTESLNHAMSSVYCVQLIVAAVIFLITILATVFVPALLRSRLGVFEADAQWVIFFLGSSLAIQHAFNTYVGVMTGCHRWDHHNMINAGFYAGTVIAMLVGVSLGGGLRTLAISYCCGVLATEVCRVYVAKRVCPELRIRFRLARWGDAKRMLAFGGKTFVGSLSGRLLIQTNNILVVTFLGPAALAMYSRPMGLIGNVGAFVSKYAYLLTPIASHLDAADMRKELQDLVYRTTRYSVHMALPPILFLCILGSPILRLWMGKEYDHGLVLLILAVGGLVPIAHRPLMNVMTGLNAHGLPALANLAAAIGSVAMCLFLLGPMQGGLASVAFSVSLSLVLVDGVFMPIYACRRIGLSTVDYLRHAWEQPILCSIPFALCLVISRLVYSDQPATALLSGIFSGGTVIGVVYWRWVLPESVRDKVIRFSKRIRMARVPDAL